MRSFPSASRTTIVPFRCATSSKSSKFCSGKRMTLLSVESPARCFNFSTLSAASSEWGAVVGQQVCLTFACPSSVACKQMPR